MGTWKSPVNASLFPKILWVSSVIKKSGASLTSLEIYVNHMFYSLSFADVSIFN